MPERIRPIVEFFPLDWVETPRGGKCELFSEEYDEQEHRYYAGVKKDLQASSGIYLFYDSRGRALYAGKAAEQSLWAEMNSVYNRSRDEVQRIKLVSHPTNNVVYRKTSEQTRKISERAVKLHVLADYVSAYEIKPKSMIGMFEALLIRAFANDLLNQRMEAF